MDRQIDRLTNGRRDRRIVAFLMPSTIDGGHNNNNNNNTTTTTTTTQKTFTMYYLLLVGLQQNITNAVTNSYCENSE